MSRYISGTAWKRALLFASMLVLSMVTVASAITIVVDGTREAVWDTGAGGQVPGFQNDLNEGAIGDGYDVQQFLWTNDTSNMYFAMQTYASTIWTGTPRPTLVICMDTDNNTGTGGAYANCNGMTGIDRSIVIDRGAAISLNVDVLDSDPNTGNSLGAGTGVRVNTFNEISVPLSLLGLNSSTACTGPIPSVVYFDNGIVDPDDNTPDAGTFNMSCGAPTAVTLSNSMAQSHTTALTIFAISGVLLLGLFSFSAVAAAKAKTSTSHYLSAKI